MPNEASAAAKLRLLWLTEPPERPMLDRLKYTCEFFDALRASRGLDLVEANHTARKALGWRAFRKAMNASTYRSLAHDAAAPPRTDAVLLPHACTANGKMLPYCFWATLPEADPPLVLIINKVFSGLDLKLKVAKAHAARILLLVSATPHVASYAELIATPRTPAMPSLFLPYAASPQFGRYALDADAALDELPEAQGDAAWLAPTMRKLRHELTALRRTRDSWLRTPAVDGSPTAAGMAAAGMAAAGMAAAGAGGAPPAVRLAEFLPYKTDLGFTGGAEVLSARYAFRAAILEGNSSVQHALRARGVRFDRPYFMPTDTYVRMLAVTKVWLATTEKGDHASTRFFEVLISGRALLLCDRNPTALAPLGIVEGEHAAMFNTTDELLGTLQYYLEHEEERERLVRNARALALRRHLWRHRAATLARHVRGALRGARHDRQHRVNAV